MKVLNLGLFPLLTLGGAAAVAVMASKHGHDAFRHREIANRTEGNALAKRYTHTRWTYYDVGLGACGKTNVPSDFIVALNSAQFGGGYPGPHCFQAITMTYGGKTTTAHIMDECPGCPYGGLDLSRGLFDFFASEDLGVISGSWSFGDGGDDGGNDPPKPTTTKKPHTTSKETPTTTEAPEHTSSKYRPTTTTVSSATTSEVPTSASISTAPLATSTTDDSPANLNRFVLTLDALSGLVIAGSQLD